MTDIIKTSDPMAELDVLMIQGGHKAVSESPLLKLRGLVQKGWRETYTALFGEKWVEGLAKHHIEAIVWHWDSRLDFLQGRYPKYDAYFPIWSRGHQKSGIARRIAIMEGILSYTYKVPTYILYLSRNKDMALKHSKSIETLLQESGVRTWCPKLAQEQVNEQKRSKGWTAKFIYTAANAIYHFAGLEEGMAGGNLETNTDQNSKTAMTDVRVVQFILDDIDGREDSPLIAENRLKTLTEEVLPMGQDNSLSFFAQNLIKHNSTMYRIWTQQVHVLTGRKKTDPVPAVEKFKYETRTNEDGIIQDVYVSGTPTWDVWDARRIQQEINRFGIEAFKRECVVEGTRVRVGWQTNVPIEQIRVGDGVLTHENRLRCVKDRLERLYTGTMYSIIPAGLTTPLHCTENHPFFVARYPDSRGRWFKQHKDTRLDDAPKEWAMAKTLKLHDMLLEPVPTQPEVVVDNLSWWTFHPKDQGRPASGHTEIRHTKNLYRLFGYYLANGSLTGGGISLTFANNKQAYLDDIAYLMTDVFGVKPHQSPDNGDSSRVVLSSIIAHRFFEQFGQNSHTKYVPDDMFMASDEFLKALLIGYMRGDGCKDKSGFSYQTVSEHLADHIRLIMLRLGVVSNLHTLKSTRQVKLPQGNWITRRPTWVGDIGGGFAVKLGEIMGMPHISKGRNDSFLHEGFVWRPIRKITPFDVVDLSVYNLEVDEDESYLANNHISHNCLHQVSEDRTGKILHNYRDSVHAISESEFASVYGSLDAWLSWRKKPGNDWAKTKTDKHANVAGWLTRSSEGTKFPGVTFLMYPMSFPEQSGAEDVAERILSCLSPYAYYEGQTGVTWSQIRKQTVRRLNADSFTSSVPEKLQYEHGELSRIIPKYSRPLMQKCNVQQGDMSHEQDTIRKMYANVYGIGFKPVNPRKYGGVELINSEMKIDETVEHPFRPNEMGYTRWFIVVTDDKSVPPYREADGKPVWKPSPLSESLITKDLVDGDLARYQITNYRNKPAQTTISGERIDEPEKVYDDVPQMMGMWYVGSQLQGSSLTPDQKLDIIVPNEFKENYTNATTANDRLVAQMAWDFNKDFYAKQLGQRTFDGYEDGFE